MNDSKALEEEQGKVDDQPLFLKVYIAGVEPVVAIVGIIGNLLIIWKA